VVDAQLHKEQGEESALQNTIFEEEGLIEEALKKKEHVGTQITHLQVRGDGWGAFARARVHAHEVNAFDARAGRHEA